MAELCLPCEVAATSCALHQADCITGMKSRWSLWIILIPREISSERRNGHHHQASECVYERKARSRKDVVSLRVNGTHVLPERAMSDSLHHKVFTEAAVNTAGNDLPHSTETTCRTQRTDYQRSSCSDSQGELGFSPLFSPLSHGSGFHYPKHTPKHFPRPFFKAVTEHVRTYKCTNCSRSRRY